MQWRVKQVSTGLLLYTIFTELHKWLPGLITEPKSCFQNGLLKGDIMALPVLAMTYSTVDCNMIQETLGEGMSQDDD